MPPPKVNSKEVTALIEALGRKPGFEPKPLVGKEAAEAAKLRSALDARTQPLTPGGEGTLGRVPPSDFGIALDQALGGGKVGELGLAPEDRGRGRYPGFPGLLAGVGAAGVGAALLTPGSARADDPNADLQPEGFPTSSYRNPNVAPQPGTLVSSDGQQMQLDDRVLDQVRNIAANPRIPQRPDEVLARNGQMTEDGLQPQVDENGNVVKPLFQSPKELWGDAWDKLRLFKSEHIAPVVNMIQTANREALVNGRLPGMPPRAEPEAGPLGKLRKADPSAAFEIENLGKLALGETDLNQPGSQHPAARKAINDATAFWGDTGAAFLTSMMQQTGSLPLYSIGGPVSGGLISGMIDPEADPESNVVAGVALHGAFSALGAGVSKLAGAVEKTKGEFDAARKGTFSIRVPQGGRLPNPERANWQPPEMRKFFMRPIALTPPEEVGDLAHSLGSLPASVIPSKTAVKDAAVIVVTRAPNGQLERSAVILPDPPAALGPNSTNPGTLRARREVAMRIPLTNSAKVADDIPVISTPEVEASARADPAGEENWVLSPGKFSGFRDLSRELDMTDWTTQEVAKYGDGLVLAFTKAAEEGGMARLYEASSPALFSDIMRSRGLAEVRREDGSRVLGFVRNLDNGEQLLVRPDASEAIPGGATADFKVGPGDTVRTIESNPELRGLFAQRKLMLEEINDAHALADATNDALQKRPWKTPEVRSAGAPPPVRFAMDPPAPIRGPEPTNVDQLEELRWRQEPSLGDKISRQMLPPTARGPIDQRNAAIMAASADAFKRLAPEKMQAFAREFPELGQMKPWEQANVQRDISSWMNGDLKLEDLQRKHPQVTNTLSKRLQDEMAAVQRRDRELRALNMLQPEEELSKLLGYDPTDDDILYTGVKLYFRHLLPAGEWAKAARKDEQGMKALTAAIMQDVYSTPHFKEKTPEQRWALAERHLDYLLGDPALLAESRQNPQSAWKDLISEASGSLKARKDLRWWEKAALGEIDNGFLRLAESTARQEQLIQRGKMWRDITQNPSMCSVEINPAVGHTHQLSLTPSKYGMAAGKWVSPELFEAVEQIPLMQRNVQNSIGHAITALKWAQTVGNPGSWWTNYFSNAQNVLLSNLVNPFSSPLVIGRGFRRFSNDYKAHMLNPGGRETPEQARFMDALSGGILGSDYASAEFKRSAMDWARVLQKEEATFGKVHGLDLMNRLGRSKDWLSGKYGAIDPMWKYATFSAGLEKGGINPLTHSIDSAKGRLKAIKFLGPLYNPALDNTELQKAVTQEVLRRIHLSFPMLDRVSPAVTKMGKNIGFINPYVKVRMEQLRVYSQLPSRLMNEPGMRGTMLMNVALMGSLYAGLKFARSANGMTQQRVDEAWASAPDYIKRFKPGAMALPFRDQHGRVQFLDFTSGFEPATYLQGSPEAAWYKKVAINFALSPVDGSVAEPGLLQMLANGGIADPTMRDPSVAQWQQGGASLMGDLVAKFGPQIFRNTYNTLERGGVGFEPKTRAGVKAEPQSPWTTAINVVMGSNRTFAYGSEKDKKASILETYYGKVAPRIKELRDVAKKTDGQSAGTLRGALDKKEALGKAKVEVQQGVQQLKDQKKKVGK
ncbi:hypothetical protein [Caudoviricetes sp.]|nr:hypothetical protein [Caudoviricetes sp.]UOF81895.1 hypothetical protein [Caudoviricetes sp.]